MSASTLPAHLLELETRLKSLEQTRLLYTFVGLGIATFILVVGIYVAEAHNAGSFSRGISRFFDYPADMIAQAWDAGWDWPPLLLKHLPALLSTINMALLSTLTGAIFALVVSVLASANLVRSTLVVQFTRRLMDLCRSFPELVIAMIFLYLMGKSELPAVIAIIIHTTGALGKLFSEAIENIDTKPIEGLSSVGAGWIQRIRFGVLPQVLPLFLSYTLLRLEINVRASTILGFVGAGGIGEALSTVIQWRYGDEITAIMVLLVVTITFLDWLSGRVRSVLIGSTREAV